MDQPPRNKGAGDFIRNAITVCIAATTAWIVASLMFLGGSLSLLERRMDVLGGRVLILEQKQGIQPAFNATFLAEEE